MRIGTFVAGGIVLMGSVAAHAQSDPASQAHLAAANQLGMLQYCKAQGFAGDDVVAAEQASIQRLPASSVSTDAAEAAGRQGDMLAPNGTRTNLASMADAQHSSVGDLCKRMASAVVQAAAMTQRVTPGGMPQMPAGMPTMPNGVPTMSGGMPAMPAMPTMPGGGMPAMPNMPGTAPRQ